MRHAVILVITMTRRTATVQPANITAAVSALDKEIALLQDMRKTASCDGELDFINECIDGIRAERRALYRTR